MQILVIILSVFLAIFLLLGIILTILLIKVTVQIRRVTETAQHAVDNIDSVASQFARFATPMALGKFIFRRFGKFKK